MSILFFMGGYTIPSIPFLEKIYLHHQTVFYVYFISWLYVEGSIFSESILSIGLWIYFLHCSFLSILDTRLSKILKYLLFFQSYFGYTKALAFWYYILSLVYQFLQNIYIYISICRYLYTYSYFII